MTPQLLVGAGVLALLAYVQSRSRAAGDAADPLAELDAWARDAIEGFTAPSVWELLAMSEETNVSAFLKVIRHGEGTVGPNGYRTLFGGDLFVNWADHPRRPVTRAFGDKLVTSTAAGAYQILARTWDDVQSVLQLPDFSPQSQDAAAVFLIRRRRALDDVRAGRFNQAIAKCAREWASLPGSPYGQPIRKSADTLAEVRAFYAAAGGTFA